MMNYPNESPNGGGLNFMPSPIMQDDPNQTPVLHASNSNIPNMPESPKNAYEPEIPEPHSEPMQ